MNWKRGNLRWKRKSKKKDDVGDGEGSTFREKIMKVLDELDQEQDWSFEEELARQNAVVEYYYGVLIHMHYPLLKKLNQLKHLNYCFELDAKRNGLIEE